MSFIYIFEETKCRPLTILKVVFSGWFMIVHRSVFLEGLAEVVHHLFTEGSFHMPQSSGYGKTRTCSRNFKNVDLLCQ